MKINHLLVHLWIKWSQVVNVHVPSTGAQNLWQEEAGKRELHKHVLVHSLRAEVRYLCQKDGQWGRKEKGSRPFPGFCQGSSSDEWSPPPTAVPGGWDTGACPLYTGRTHGWGQRPFSSVLSWIRGRYPRHQFQLRPVQQNSSAAPGWAASGWVLRGKEMEFTYHWETQD